MTNPLLVDSQLPAFDAINTEHMEPAISKLLAQGRQLIAELTQQQTMDWDSVIAPLHYHDNRISQAFAPISQLNNVLNSPKLRKAHQNCLNWLSEYYTEIGQHHGLFNAYQQIRASSQFEHFDCQKQRSIDNAVRDFKLSGVNLSADDQSKFKSIQARLSELSNQFENNVLDATDNWHYHTQERTELHGLPQHTIAAAEHKAHTKGEPGWILGIDAPTYLAVMMHAHNRDLRQKFYTAFCTRASDQGPDAGKFNNSAIINEILQLRQQKAKLLDMANFAELSLATKMADSPEQIYDFLHKLAKQALPQAKRELEQLQDFAHNLGLQGPLKPWDLAYYSEQLKQERLGIDDETLRAYFPVDKVLTGMFSVIKKLYGLTVTPRKVTTWHSDVKFYDVHDSNQQHRGSFYIDLYAREHKRGGAWMDECRSRIQTDSYSQYPVAYLNCNFTPPLPGASAYITHDDVVTLFHEFGHTLHHILTKVDVFDVSGINGVEWDAVELPSQFMENFAWQQEVVQQISCHQQTGEPLPDHMFDQLVQLRHFQSAMSMCRQLEFSLFDLHLHWDFDPDGATSVLEVLRQVRNKVGVTKQPDFNRFPHGFSHIFAGGYAAGYYSYKWAEVLSSDAFSRFEQEGIFNATTGRSFLNCILEQGGSRPAKELFYNFRGRDPQVEPLLRHSGIV